MGGKDLQVGKDAVMQGTGKSAIKLCMVAAYLVQHLPG